jgi:Icc-related predicted phosphoesterase
MSDLHGELPDKLPDCDIVLLAGDICPPAKRVRQIGWMDDWLRRWLRRIDKPVFACAGNHDWPMYESPEEVARLRLHWTYLQDKATEYEGLKIYGTPWQQKFYDWAFNLDELHLAGKWNMIPDDTDILICHSPPKYYGDLTIDGRFAGSESLTWRIKDIAPKLVVFGHIHPGRGEWRFGETTLANVAMVGRDDKLAHEPWVGEIENRGINEIR